MESAWEWLIGEAGAGWIIGLLGLCGAIYSWYLRETPPRINIQEIETIRLMDIHSSQRTSLDVRYKISHELEVKTYDLIQKHVVIYNTGTKDLLEPFEIVFQAILKKEDSSSTPMKSNDAFLVPVVDNSVLARVEEAQEDGNNVYTIRIKVPYLNSYSAHRHFLSVQLISAFEIDLELTSSTGPGWSACLVNSQQVRMLSQRIPEQLAIMSSAGACLAALLAYFLMFQTPTYRAVLNPSPKNVQAAIDLTTSNFQQISLKPFWLRFILVQPYPLAGFIGMSIVIVLMILALILRYREEQFSFLLHRMLFNSFPPETFLDS